jgi:hypothetical protein
VYIVFKEKNLFANYWNKLFLGYSLRNIIFFLMYPDLLHDFCGNIFAGIFLREYFCAILKREYFGKNILEGIFWQEYFRRSILAGIFWWQLFGKNIFKNDLNWMCLIFVFSSAKEIIWKLFTKDSTKIYNQTWQRRTKALHV